MFTVNGAIDCIANYHYNIRMRATGPPSRRLNGQF